MPLASFVGRAALASAFSAALAAQFDVLAGTVTNASGDPVAGATVRLLRRDLEGFNSLDLPAVRALRSISTLRTGKNGSFALQLPCGVPFALHVDDGVHAPVHMRAVYAGEELAVRLVPAARVSLTLRDGTGAPCAGTLAAWDEHHVRWAGHDIGADGKWTSDRLPPGLLVLDIAPESARRPQWQSVMLAAGSTTPLGLTLEAGCVLRGRVSSATGEPVAGARVGEGWTMDKFVVTDADGRYEMRGYGGAGYGCVRVTADGHGPMLRQVVSVPDGSATADFALPAACELTGRVVDAAGAPVVGAYVAAVGGTFRSGDDGTHDWSSARTDSAGRYRLRGLRRAIGHSLLVLADGRAVLVADLPNLDGDLQLEAIATRTGRYVSGTVVDGNGGPVAGLEVSLRGANRDRTTLADGTERTGCPDANYCIAVRTMKTDSRGRIHFAGVAPGSYRLRVGVSTASEGLPLEVPADRDPAPIRIPR